MQSRLSVFYGAILPRPTPTHPRYPTTLSRFSSQSANGNSTPASIFPPNSGAGLTTFIGDPQFAPRQHAYDVIAMSPDSAPYSRYLSNAPSSLRSQAEAAKKGRYQALCNELEVCLHRKASDAHGSVGPGTQTSLHRIFEYMTSRKRDQSHCGTPPTAVDSQLSGLAANCDCDKSQKTAST